VLPYRVIGAMRIRDITLKGTGEGKVVPVLK
jgi:hypothetical protein